MPASRVLHASTLARTLFATTVLLLLGTLQPRTSLAAGATTEPTTAPAGEQASAAKATAAVTPAGGTGASPQVSSGTLTGATLATIDPASGSATTSVDFETPSARGLPQQDLSLAYNSASLEDGLGGRGWTLNIPSIERRGVADGPPFVTKAVTSTDGTVANFHFTPEDRYSFNGRDLVLICTWGVPCPSNRQDIFPTWAQVNGWRYFRLQNEGLFARFFLDPTGKTWRVEFKDGQVWEFGTPTVGVGAGFAFPSIDTEPRTGTAFRWNLVRKFDTQGGTSPVNIVAYIWAPLRNAAREPANTLPLYYLTDVYDTPAANASSSPYGYAHHTQLTYELPTFAPNAYTAIWRARPHQRLIGVDVTSFVAQAVGKVAASTQRALVRRYHLGYSESRHHSYLSTVQMEGRCDTPPVEPIPAVTSCATLPPTTFTYSTGSLNTAPFELKASGNPINSGAHPFAAITDVNADGLPDLVQTQGSNLALYLNAQASGTPGFVGTLSSLSGGPASSGSLLSATSSVSVPGDYGTGTPSAVFWFPGATTNCTASTFIGGSIYGDQIGNCELGTIYTPTSNAGQWSWTSSTTDSHWAGEWDVVNGFVEGVRAKQWVGDIDADGLADVLSFIATPDPNTGADEDIATFAIFYRTTREENGAYHPFAPLAMTYNHATVYTLGGADVNGSFAASTQPSKAEDLVDFNGDGLLDFMSADTNVPRVSYCTFDGIGFGNRCDWGSVGTDPYATNVPLTLSAGMPLKQSVQTFMHDVDGDGFPDLLAATPTGIVVNFSQDAASLDPDPTHLVTLAWKLFGVSYDASGSTWQLSFADMNGSGVDDLVVFTQAGRFFYVDFVDGAPTGWANSNALASNSPSAPRPGLLLSVSNGLGGLTSITYGSSTDEQRQAAAAGQPWVSTSPAAKTVVLRTESSSGIGLRRTVLYTHRDAIYDTWSHQTIGFQHVSMTNVGDSTEPTSVTDTTYLPVSGGCTSFPCAPSTGNEPAAPVPILIEKRDANGVYLSTTHIGYQQSEIYLSQEGDSRVVQSFTPEITETLIYETNNQAPPRDGQVISNTYTANVFRNDAGTTSPGTPTQPYTIHPRAATYSEIETQVYRDAIGNTLREIDLGQVSAPGTGIDQGTARTSTWTTYGTSWTWRVTSVALGATNSDGSSATPTRTLNYAYDTSARLTGTTSVVTGTKALVRTGNGSPAVAAPQPRNAVAENSTISLVSYGYDSFGNVTSIVKPNGRCLAYQYTDTYAQFPDVISVGCGVSQSTLRFYDWAFGIDLASDGPNGTNSLLTLDQFGRVVQVRAPDPKSGLATQILATADYPITTGAPLQFVHVTTPAGETWSYFDGFGEPFGNVKRIDASSALVSGMTLRNVKGSVYLGFAPWISTANPVGQLSPATVPTSSATTQQFDAFGRVLSTTALDGSIASKVTYHPLSQDLYSAADVDGTRKAGPSSVYYDGHGRAIRTVAYNSVPTLDALTTKWTYAPTGEVTQVVQSHSNNSADSVTRTMAYDSIGRLVSNTHPDTGTWLYAYDAAGDVVGTSDARGCGKNVFYDRYGRVQGEDYSPCTAGQPAYTPPALFRATDGLWYLSSGDGAEVYNTYDAPEDGQTGDFGPSESFLVGRLAAVTDRGAHTRYGYDARGRLVSIARQLATPTAATGTVAPAYANHWFRKSIAYDDANRILRTTTGADDPELFGTADPTNDGSGGGSAVTYGYSTRGTLSTVGGSYGPLASFTKWDPDGLLRTVTLNDAGKTTASFDYTTNRLLLSHIVGRPSGSWGPGNIIQDSFQYDSNGNPSKITDGRNASEWPAGAQPATRGLLYDDFGQLTDVTYGSPTAQDQQNPVAINGAAMPSAKLTHRVSHQAFAYDWLGNMLTSSDDVPAFYERSLGAAKMSAHQLVSSTSPSGDSVKVAYDLAGNISTIKVAATHEGSGIFELFYCWDEVGQLVRAIRYPTILSVPGDWTPPLSDPNADVMLTFSYSEGSRALTHSQYRAALQRPEAYAARVFDTLRVNGATFDAQANDYSGAQTAYLGGLARAVYATNDIPASASGKLHVFYELNDELGSASAVVDKDTGEVVERATYQAFGAADSDYQPSRWGTFHEDYRFTGADSDDEVGLSQLGARYYSPFLRRWISPDPLNVHSFGGDQNPYRYANNSPLRFVDPTGLEANASNCWGSMGKEGCFSYGPPNDGQGTSTVAESSGGNVGDAIDHAINGVFNALDNLFGLNPPGRPPPPTPRSVEILAGPTGRYFSPLSTVNPIAHALLISDRLPARLLQSDGFLTLAQLSLAQATIMEELALATYGASGPLAAVAQAEFGNIALGTKLLADSLAGLPALATAGGAATGGPLIASQVGQEIEEVLPEVGQELTTVYRVEGLANQRLSIDPAGNVTFQGTHMLFLNFGDAERADEFYETRVAQGMDGVTIKTFQVPTSFVDELSGSAVPEKMARRFPDAPLVVDITKGANQFGLRPQHVEALRQVIIPGSGSNE